MCKCVNYYEPLFLPIGLAVLAVYPIVKKLIHDT